MKDEYVEEIQNIRKSIYIETENMNSEELDQYYRLASEEFEKLVAERRALRGSQSGENERKSNEK